VSDCTHAGAVAGLVARPEHDGVALTFRDSGSPGGGSLRLRSPLAADARARARFCIPDGARRGLVQVHGGHTGLGSLNGRTLFQLLIPGSGGHGGER